MPLGLELLCSGAARAAEGPPVLVGYIKKVQPDRGGDREVGVEKARITMKGTVSWVETDADGLFRLQLLRSIRLGQSIEVEVRDVPGWLLYQPAGGRVVVPEQAQTVTLKLLPKGSLRFLESQGLASLLSRMMSEAKDSLRTAPVVAPGGPPPPVDLKGPMQKWASEYGLSLEQVQTAVDKWAQEVLKRRQQDDEQLCLAHYSQQQLEQAAQCFDALGQSEVQELERIKAQLQERTQRAVRRFVQAGEAYGLRYDFAAALKEYEQAARWAKRDVSPTLWAEVQNLLGIAHYQLGIRVAGEASRTHLAQAVAALRLALEVRTKTDLPQEWAMTQNNLGAVHFDQARRMEGPAGAPLLAQAVAAFRLALEVYTKTDQSQNWAQIQNNLGNALHRQAERTEGPAGAELLTEAVAALRLALEVHTKTELPQAWAMTQNNLGIVLRNQARRTAGPAGTALLAQAVATFRLALEVHTRTDLPQNWATTQNHLGLALSDQAERLPADSAARTELLSQAQAAFRSMLEIYTHPVFPFDWARAHMNLARTCALLPDDRCVADSFANVLRIHPNWARAYTESYVGYHEKLFLFAEAHALNQAWLARHPEDREVWANFVESTFTTGRLAEVSTLLAQGFAGRPAADQVPLLALEAAALAGQGKASEAASKRGTLRELVASQAADFRLTWTFVGSRHFLQTDPRFSAQRAQLLALLYALEQPNRAAILTALDACCRATSDAK